MDKECHRLSPYCNYKISQQTKEVFVNSEDLNKGFNLPITEF